MATATAAGAGHGEGHITTFAKALSESPGLTSIPSSYTFAADNDPPVYTPDRDSIPVIDFSLIVSDDHNRRSKAVEELGRACWDWGFFMVINHGVPERLMNTMIEACRGFFDLSEDEKREFHGKHVLDPIRCGTSFNASVEKVIFWSDFLKVMVHPKFHSPSKPENFSDVLSKDCEKVRDLAKGLLGGIPESLGLERGYLNKVLDMQSGLQILTANLYPPCPQPELAMGMPPHSDHGLLTVLLQNGIGGLQVFHGGSWVMVDVIRGAFLVNTGDHLEIATNGKYKSVIHRAVVNSAATRMSIAVVNGPSPDTLVYPAEGLLERGGNRAAYVGMKYREYLELQQGNVLDGKSSLHRVKIELTTHEVV